MKLTSLLPQLEQLDLRSCLVSHRGELIARHYRNRRTAEEPGKINSCTKSVLASLICIAMDQGILPEPSAKASLFFPQLAAAADRRKQAITIEHLLTMSAGFQWQEFGGLNSFPRMSKTGDWIAFTLEQPMADEPGSRMEYNSGVSQLLAFMLAEASGMSVARFAERYLFEPLEIADYEWEQDPQGIHTGGFGLRMKPEDMLKFGQLYEQEGLWKQARLISPDLLLRSVAPAIEAESPRRGRYGWHWWSDSYGTGSTANSPSSSFDYYYALGFGGQLIVVVPMLEIVAVVTSDKYKRGRSGADVFREHIAPLLAP